MNFVRTCEVRTDLSWHSYGCEWSSLGCNCTLPERLQKFDHPFPHEVCSIHTPLSLVQPEPKIMSARNLYMSFTLAVIASDRLSMTSASRSVAEHFFHVVGSLFHHAPMSSVILFLGSVLLRSFQYDFVFSRINFSLLSLLGSYSFVGSYVFVCMFVWCVSWFDCPTSLYDPEIIKVTSPPLQERVSLRLDRYGFNPKRRCLLTQFTQTLFSASLAGCWKCSPV